MLRAIIASLLLTLLSAPALADIHVENAWARETPPGGGHGAGYLVIHNHSDETQTLVGAEFEGASTVEIHRTTDQDGMARMEEMKDGVEIAPHETLRLEPGSYHLMLMGLDEPLVKDNEHELVLSLEPAGDITTTLKVRSRDSDGSDSDHHHHH